jgi:hypothetical protein
VRVVRAPHGLRNPAHLVLAARMQMSGGQLACDCFILPQHACWLHTPLIQIAPGGGLLEPREARCRGGATKACQGVVF